MYAENAKAPVNISMVVSYVVGKSAADGRYNIGPNTLLWETPEYIEIYI